ncbi:MAG TPA: NAD(P)H-binding protein [Chthoniobacterales bacterium]|nr:NAD(P)H-binding protein [Chthoniobacterales bacterium]
MARICVTGGTGYIGARLIPLLANRGHQVKAVVRPGSEKKISANVSIVRADPLQEGSYTDSIRGCDTFVHLIGVPHPSPAKAAQFRAIDLPSIQVAAKAAREAGIRHFVYLSVAQPASMMQAFIAVRAEGEALLRASGMNATFVRPWYVLGPGHWWPCAILPFYWIAELLPPTRESAQRLGLITISQMLSALVWAVENSPEGVRIFDVPRIRELSRSRPS